MIAGRRDLLGLLCCFFLLTFFPLFMNSQTVDEPEHRGYGLKILETGDFSRGTPETSSKMPVSVLHALPLYVAERLGNPGAALRLPNAWANRLFYGGDQFPCSLAGRIFTVGFSWFLVVTVFRWARELYGETGGLLSLTLCVFCPNLLAHGILMTTDLPVTSLAFVCVYYFRKFLTGGGWAPLVKSAMACGVAQLTKYTALHLLPILFLLSLCVRTDFPCRDRIKRFLSVSLVYLAIVLFFINAGFLFRRTGASLNAYHFQSESLKKWQSFMTGVNVPIPVPYPYLEGLDETKFYDENCGAAGNPYLLGWLQEGTARKGWWSYFLVAFLLKMPTPVLLLLGMCFWLALETRSSWGEDVFLLIPAAYIFFYFSLFMRAQIGFRYVLPALPFLYVWAGRLASPRLLKPVYLGILCLWLSVSTLSYFPFFVSYFNESIGSRKNAYLYLSDSNLQFGQENEYAERWLQFHPEASYFPSEEVKPYLLVDANFLTGVRHPELCRWLREGYLPVDHVAYGYLLYHVPEPENIKIRT